MKGPKLAVVGSCFQCDYYEQKFYRVQGDSGFDKYCNHPDVSPTGARRSLGNTTPRWCPFYDEALKELMELP